MLFVGTAAGGCRGCGKGTTRVCGAAACGGGGGREAGGGVGARIGTCCGTDVDWEAINTSGGISLSLIGAPERADWSNSWTV